ncbi:hypothetical protein GGH14_005353, partial [Coemansia sp. RSA 370]
MECLATSDEDFIQSYRMPVAQFEALVELIEHDPAINPGGGRPAAPAWFQLAVGLFRLGRKKPVVVDIARTFEISVGSVENYTENIVCAIIWCLSQEMVWPQPQDQTLSTCAGLGFADTVGHMDGTHITLEHAPSLNQRDYYN